MMYWIDLSLDSYKIEAAYLNGTGRRILLKNENTLYIHYAALGLHDGNIYIAESERTHSYGCFFTLLNYPLQRESRNCWWCIILPYPFIPPLSSFFSPVLSLTSLPYPLTLPLCPVTSLGYLSPKSS